VSAAEHADRTPDTVVFDLGGVLIDWDPRLLYRTLLPEDEVEAFLVEVEFAEWNALQDAGRPFAEAVEVHAKRFPHRRELLAAYHERFPETMVGPIQGTVDILRELGERGTRLLALTNWSAETFGHARDRFDFLAEFESILVSGEVKLAKPDPRIFALLVETYRLRPPNTVYIDDSARNVAAGTSAGLRSLLFSSPEQLRADLSRLGVLAGAP
jgi:2-haloacid dehalogenase